MTEVVDIAVIGGGQAGLSLSHELSQADVEHVVLERGRVGEAWRGRWDSFCLVTPNWTVQLPEGRYNGDDPDGFMPRDDIVDHLVGYARSFRAPVCEGVDVRSLKATDKGGFLLATSTGDIRAREVVLASGGYQKPYRPAAADQLPASLHVLDAGDYSNPAALPPGKVLIVGGGQTGCQLAEELTESGRDTYLACGRAPWIHRRLGGRDFVSWILDTPLPGHTLADLPSPSARLIGNVLASGRRGGHDLHYRTLQALGVRLLGHFIGVQDDIAHFAPDLADSVAFGDARYNDFCGAIRTACAERGVDAPEMPPPPPFVANPPERLTLERVGAVIFASGYRPDYTSWVSLPDAFDEMGFPIQHDGSSTVVPGLHFMGVHFQRKRMSATFLGVAEDAAVLAENIAASRHR